MEITLTGEWRRHAPRVQKMEIGGCTLTIMKLDGWASHWEWDIHQQTPTGHVWITGNAVNSEQIAKESAEQALCAVLGVSVGARL